MSGSNGQPLDAIEVAALAADDPRRAAFIEALSDAGERESWRREWAETDRVRGVLGQVAVPGDLQDRLRRIPESRPVEAPPARGVGNMQVGWRSVAAVVMVAGLLAGAYAWYAWKPKPLPMDRTLSRSIAEWAVKSSDRELDIASADPAEVKKKLESYGFSFPVIMLAPSDAAKVTLQGGGIAELGPAKAAYTRWAGAGYQLTLYEFNGNDVSAPPVFQMMAEVPQELWRGEKHYRVLIFPGAGGKCCWALVMDSDHAENAFSEYMAGNY